MLTTTAIPEINTNPFKVVMLIKSCFVVLMMMLFVSCEDTQELDPEEDFIIFGQFDGYCYGGCDAFYRVDDSRLLKSLGERYSKEGFYPFNTFEELSNDKFNLVNDLSDFIPPSLWDDLSTHIGKPELSDAGVYYFEIQNDSIHRHWAFENGDFDMDPEYRIFINKIIEKIELIK